MATRNCLRCHEAFVPKATGRKRKYCSDSCKESYRKVGPLPESRPCAQCGVEIDRSKRYGTAYCSKPCARRGHFATPEAQTLRRDAYLRREYGISADRLDALLAAQGGCAVCGVTQPFEPGWQVDHDHACCAGRRSCGACVRGILCHRCNSGIGMLGDSADRLLAATAYLLQWTDVLAAVKA